MGIIFSYNSFLVVFLISFCFNSCDQNSVGIHQRPGDLEVNVCKQKQLTNMRSATKGITVGLTSSIELSLDESVEYLAPDELLEVRAR